MPAMMLNLLAGAQAALRRLDFDVCVEMCTTLLSENPLDQAGWLLKCRALTERAYVDDVEWDEEGIADALLDDNAVAQAPRPGTTLGAGAGGKSSSLRPLTASGRPTTGFLRPGTSSSLRLGTGLDLRAGRQGTAMRASTALGRVMRLGTASLMSAPGGPFIAPDRLDLRKYARRPALARALCDYLLYVEHNPRKALELASIATVEAGYSDWWWKERLGKCYVQLGLLRDAERQFASSSALQPMVATSLQAARVAEKLDQPIAALAQLRAASERFPGDVHLAIAQARVHEALGASDEAGAAYRAVLATDAIHAEALACLAANAFYSDQPEVAVRYYRRLLQVGASSPELWANLGLSSYYAGMFDLCLPCFDRAIACAGDDTVGDVWYNVGVLAVGMGDAALATQAFTVALAKDSSHPESHVNLGVLEMRRERTEVARSHFVAAQGSGPHLPEAWYNGALLSWRAGDVQAAFTQARAALDLQPEHAEAGELMRLVREALHG